MGNPREHVESRLTVVCHLWPGITPWNVWSLPLRQWLMFAAEADEWVRSRQQQEV